MRYAIYNIASGEIVRIVNCAAAQLQAQLDEHHSAVASDTATDDGHYIAGGKSIARPERPSANHQWDFWTRAWVDRRTIEELKAAKWEAIKAQRQAVIDSPLVTQFGVFSCDARGRDGLKEVIQLSKDLAGLDMASSVRFTPADNMRREFTGAQIAQVGRQMAQKTQRAHDIADSLRSAIGAASTVSELEAVSWPT